MPPKQNSGARAAYQQLKKDLREGSTGRLYIFCGEEAYLRDHYLQQLHKRLIPDGMESFNSHSLNERNFSMQALSDLVDALPMMSPCTLITVYDVDLFRLPETARKQLVALLSDLPEYCTLVFVYDIIAYKSDARMKQLAGAIKEHGSVVSFDRQSQGDLTDWIHRRVKATGHQIDTSDAQYLIFLCGDLMHGLLSEIEKIAAYASGLRITRADIDAVAIPLLDAVVFQMTDAMTQRDYDKAFAVLAELLRMQEAPIKILAALGKHLRQLLTARLAFESGRQADYLAQLWGMRSPYGAQKLFNAARRFSLDWCCRAVRLCAQADVSMKTGSDPEEQLLTLLLTIWAQEVRHATH